MPTFASAIIPLYTRHAATWDRSRGRYPTLELPWLRELSRRLPPGGSVLDLGCGSGFPIANYFAERHYDVTGIDASAPLIDICRSRMPDQTWIVGDFRKLALQETFNGIIAWHSFFHLKPEDQRAMFPVFAAHAAPGATLLFTSGPSACVEIGEWQGEKLYHASLDAKEYRALLNQNGFDVIEHVANDPKCGNATIWLAWKRLARIEPSTTR